MYAAVPGRDACTCAPETSLPSAILGAELNYAHMGVTFEAAFPKFSTLDRLACSDRTGFGYQMLEERKRAAISSSV